MLYFLQQYKGDRVVWHAFFPNNFYNDCFLALSYFPGAGKLVLRFTQSSHDSSLKYTNTPI